jgi:LDH2 family malate/lactate/ureidoglycolate dehydrogenase
MATSEGSRKKIRKALAEGGQIPLGWAIDSDGNPTTDPGKALEGVMLPFGGAKGSAITLLADLLSGVLSGGNFGTAVRSVYSNQEQECGTGHFILVMKVASFMPVEDFKQRMDEQFAAIRSLKPAAGFAAVSYPGDRETRLEQERSARGIPITEPVLGEMQKLAGELVIRFP